MIWLGTRPSVSWSSTRTDIPSQCPVVLARTPKAPVLPRAVGCNAAVTEGVRRTVALQSVGMALLLAVEQRETPSSRLHALSRSPYGRQTPCVPGSRLGLHRSPAAYVVAACAVQTAAPDGDKGARSRPRLTWQRPHPTRRRTAQRSRRSAVFPRRQQGYRQEASPVLEPAVASTGTGGAPLSATADGRATPGIYHRLTRQRSAVAPTTPEPAPTILRNSPASRRFRAATAVQLAV